MSFIKLLTIPSDKYDDYKNKVIFNSYKWDPQVEDVNTVSDHILVISEQEAKELSNWTERLSQETILLEEALLNKPSLYSELGLGKTFKKALALSKNYKTKDHVRLMRFDFHPCEEGWVVSEVNSDVPGGFAEASILPHLAAELFDDLIPYGNLGESLVRAFSEKLNPNSTIAYVHATSYADDRQVMEFVKDCFEEQGFKSLIVAPDHLRWSNGTICIANGQKGKVDGIIRFYPSEWFCNLPRSSRWQGYFNTLTPSCNHPIALLTQSKRLPLVWDRLDVNVSTWKQLLPETKHPKKINGDWVLKPTFGRVGENITIKEVMSKRDLQKISIQAKLFPKDWVAQRRFNSIALESQSGKRHLAIGAFTVQGRFAGFYGRISSYPRVDSKAQDIAVLVKKEGKNE